MENSSDITSLLQSMRRKPGASEEIIQQAQSTLKVTLPPDYVDFLRASNGADGPLGPGYLSLWPVDTLARRNEGYQVEKFAPDLLLFGSDGGDTAYGFDLRTPGGGVVETPFIGMGVEQNKKLASNFTEFLQYLFHKKE